MILGSKSPAKCNPTLQETAGKKACIDMWQTPCPWAAVPWATRERNRWGLNSGLGKHREKDMEETK